jgi:ABC-type nitrate/sulfonate/bicarbonate transport system substrate-binding protein
MPPPEQSSIKIWISALEPNTFIPQLALDAGIYAKYGLTDVEVLTFDGSQKMTSAAIAGQIQATNGASAQSIVSQTTEAPFVSVAVFNVKFLDDIIGGKDIKTGDDLRGKRVAVSGLGGQSHNEVVVALKSLGLAPEDVGIIQVGGQGARVSALKAGSIDAIPVDSALRSDLEAEGFNLLVSLKDTDVRSVTSDLQVSRETLTTKPGLVLAVVAANLEAMQLLFTDTDGSIDRYAAWAQVERPEAETAVKSFLEVAQRDLRADASAYQNLKDFLAIGNPDVANVDVSKSFDFTALDQLKALGIDKALQVP